MAKLSKYPASKPDKNKHTPAIAACGTANEVNGFKLWRTAADLLWFSKGSPRLYCHKKVMSAAVGIAIEIFPKKSLKVLVVFS